jgi:hypothetical protein
VQPDRYRQIGKIFLEAIECSAKDRTRFLDEVCRDDDDLRREVEELLQHHDELSKVGVEDMNQGETN